MKKEDNENGNCIARLHIHDCVSPKIRIFALRAACILRGHRPEIPYTQRFPTS
jgi:hypothetical protein